jgi:hypothetical protein
VVRALSMEDAVVDGEEMVMGWECPAGMNLILSNKEPIPPCSSAIPPNFQTLA